MDSGESLEVEVTERYATEADIESIVDCDRAYSDEVLGGRWRAKDYQQVLRCSDMAILVVEIRGSLAGFAVLERYTKAFELHRIAVFPVFLRCGLGSLMVHSIKQRLSIRGPMKIAADVQESNLRAQQFFRSLGFKARMPILSNMKYGDIYRFEFTFADLIGGRFC